VGREDEEKEVAEALTALREDDEVGDAELARTAGTTDVDMV